MLVQAVHALALSAALAAPARPSRAAAAEPRAHSSFAVRATKVHLGDGTVIENGVVVVEDGRIRDVGRGAIVTRETPLLELEGELSPGLIALVDRSGGQNEDSDSTRPVAETMDVGYAFRPGSPAMRRLTEEGITSFVLVPADGNLVGGLAAAVKPGVRVLERRIWLALDLSTSALSFNRFPTSYSGALDELERRFAAGSERGGVFGEVARGDQAVLLRAWTRAEIQRALEFASRHRLTGALAIGWRLDGLAARIKASGLSVVLPPRPPGTAPQGEECARDLAAAGIRFGFGLDARQNGAALLRYTAAVAVRAGLSRDDALRALTIEAARAAGIEDHVGSLEAGRDADLVLWSGDPVDPTSRVLSVWIDGQRVFEAPPEPAEQGAGH